MVIRICSDRCQNNGQGKRRTKGTQRLDLIGWLSLVFLGSENFVMKLEGILDRILRYGKAGRPKKETGKQKKRGN